MDERIKEFLVPRPNMWILHTLKIKGFNAGSGKI